MYFGKIEALTYKSRVQQIGNTNKFVLLDNEVFSTAFGCIIAPRGLYTDNITFINNTFVDVRASHPHDIACAYHKVIVSNLHEDTLKERGFLYIHDKATKRERRYLETLKKAGKYNGDINVNVWVCEDIPAKYLEIKKITFSEANEMFRKMLKATGVNDKIANVMGNAVYLNAGWALKKTKVLPPIDRIYSDLILT